MSDFEAFFAQNKVKAKDVEYVASTGFINPKTGKPIAWILRKIDESVNKKLKESSMKKVANSKTATRYQLDNDTYLCKLTVATVAFPNLNDKELQDKWGVMDAEELVRKMLSAGEYANLMIKAQEVNDFDIDFSALVEEAKN